MTIKEIREKYNLTQSALARSLGVSSNAISGIEGGRIKLSPKMTAKIKEVYGEELTSAATEKPSEAATATPEKKTTTKKTRSVKKAAPEKAAEATAPAPEKKTTPEKPAASAPENKAAPEKAAETMAAAIVPEKKTRPVKAEETVTTAAPKAEKKAEKKPAPKKSTAEKKSEENVSAAPKAEKKPAPKKAPPTVILQSPFGGEITEDMITSRVGDVDKVYVRIDQNKLYWVKGEENGAIDIW